MSMAVVTVPNGGLPVVDVTATKPGLGRRANEALNGRGVRVTKVSNGRGVPMTFYDSTGALSTAAERTANGDFALNPINASQATVQNGWQWTRVGGTSTVTWAAGVVTITPDGTNRANLISAPLTTIIGRTYRFEFDLNGTLNVQVGTGVDPGGTGVLGGFYAANHNAGRNSITFVATATTTHVAFGRTSASAVTVDNVSVHGPL